jgi:Ca2+-binding EF-hand superfamily protein
VRDTFCRFTGGTEHVLTFNLLKGCLTWMGFPTDEEIVEALLQSNSVSYSEVTFPDYIQIVRKYREDEVTRMMDAVLRQDEDESGTIEMNEIPGVILHVGYLLSTRTVIQEAANKCGIGNKTKLSFEDVCALLDQIRSTEGFSESELMELRETFRKCDATDSGNIVGHELENAIRWMGYPTSFRHVQEVLDEFDADDSGHVDEREFLKIIASYRTNEFTQVRKLGTGGEISACTLNSEMLERFGDAVASPGRRIIKRHVSTSGLHALAATDDSFFDLAELTTSFRAEIRQQLRDHHGFTLKETAAFAEAFSEHDPDGTGKIDGKHLTKLMTDLVPDSMRDKTANERMRAMFVECDADGSGTIDTEEFVQLMRLHTDQTSRVLLEKERAAVMASGFSYWERREFRRIFNMYDEDDGGVIDFSELGKMVDVIFPDDPCSVQKEEKLRGLVERFDDDADGGADFPEFLRMMRVVVDEEYSDSQQLVNSQLTRLFDEEDS